MTGDKRERENAIPNFHKVIEEYDLNPIYS